MRVRKAIRILVAAAGLAALSSPCPGIDRMVPTDYATIQSAIDDADAHDRIVVRPGIYHEVVMIDRRSDLVIQGITDCTFSAGVPCWDAVADGALFVTIDGSIHIVSSQRITVEGLTITGQGPGVRISGTAGRLQETIFRERRWVAFRRRCFGRRLHLQASLNPFLHFYDWERPHQV